MKNQSLQRESLKTINKNNPETCFVVILFLQRWTTTFSTQHQTSKTTKFHILNINFFVGPYKRQGVLPSFVFKILFKSFQTDMAQRAMGVFANENIRVSLNFQTSSTLHQGWLIFGRYYREKKKKKKKPRQRWYAVLAARSCAVRRLKAKKKPNFLEHYLSETV